MLFLLRLGGGPYTAPNFQMSILVWNCRGMGQSTIIQTIRELIRSHRPNIIFLAEIKSSNYVFISNVVSSLGFSNFHLVPSIGKVGGLLVMWKISFLFKLF